MHLSISIPSGAIKRFWVYNGTTKVTSFQFLLVRLKVLTDKYNALFDAISIPSGAIKSPASASSTVAEVLFQFLLVRLKVLGVQRHDQSNFISIPSGAIKSGSYSYPVSTVASKFQFLLVRLKVGYVGLSDSCFDYFNSFWCD